MSQLKEGIIFPTNLHIADVFNEYQNQKYKNFLIELSKRVKPQTRSNRNGWQSDTLLWQEDIFKPLLDEALNAAHIIAKRLFDKNPKKEKELPQISVRALWGNINPKGGFNFTHVHPSGWLSGVYYIQLPEENSEIVFEDPRPARMMDFQRTCLITDEYFTYHPKVGELILFPSWLPHFVPPNTSDENRISMSFNIELVV